MFEANDPNKGGSYYLQSKIYRSREVLENELKTVDAASNGSNKGK